MRKNQRLVQIKPDKTNIHIVGQERFICVQNYAEDLPSGEPVDWFPQSDELTTLLDYPSEANDLLEDERLIDEW